MAPPALFLNLRVMSSIVGSVRGYGEVEEKEVREEKLIDEVTDEVVKILPLAVATLVMTGAVKGTKEEGEAEMAPKLKELAWDGRLLADIRPVREAEMAPNQLIQDPDKLPLTSRIERKVLKLEKKLSEGFKSLSSQEGLRVFEGLKNERDSLSLIFQGGGLDDSVINSERVGQLTGELYLQGLTLLLKALGIVQQLGSSSVDSLVTENGDLETELGKHSPDSTMFSVVSERLGKNKKSLTLVKGFRERADELFNQVGLCKDSIRGVRLELPELVASKPKDEFDRLLLELDTRMEFAQRVKEEYTRQGL